MASTEENSYAVSKRQGQSLTKKDESLFRGWNRGRNRRHFGDIKRNITKLSFLVMTSQLDDN